MHFQGVILLLDMLCIYTQMQDPGVDAQIDLLECEDFQLHLERRHKVNVKIPVEDGIQVDKTMQIGLRCYILLSVLVARKPRLYCFLCNINWSSATLCQFQVIKY